MCFTYYALFSYSIFNWENFKFDFISTNEREKKNIFLCIFLYISAKFEFQTLFRRQDAISLLNDIKEF